MKSLSLKILEQIPRDHIYRFLEEKEKNASKKQNGGVRVGSSAASRKAKDAAIKELVRNIAK